MKKRESDKIILQNLLDKTYELVALLELSLQKGEIPESIPGLICRKAGSIASEANEFAESCMGESPEIINPQVDREVSSEMDTPDTDTPGNDPTDVCAPEKSETPEIENKTYEEESIIGAPDTPGESLPNREKPKFTLNDRYLFIRELFGGDRRSFDSALTKAAGMDTREEIEDFFYYELSWDRENEEAERFIDILCKN